MGWNPLWAWVCSVLDPQDAIKELMNCVLCNWVPSRDEKPQPECGPPLLTYVLSSRSISLDHFGRPEHDLGGDRDTERPGRLQVDDQVVLNRLLHRKVRRLRAL